jgi:hypothetical protein
MIVLEVDNIGSQQELRCVEVKVVEQQGLLGEGKLWGPSKVHQTWRQGEGWQQPEVVSEERFRWGADCVEPLDIERQDEWAGWWDQQTEAAVASCLEPGGDHVGGLQEQDEHAPDVGVLGSWCYQRMAEALEGLESPQVREQTWESNPPWAKLRAEEQVFRVGSMMEHLDRFAEFGADAEVLQWMQQGGYAVKLSEGLVDELAAEGQQAVGIERPNGKRAQEHAEDLRTVVMEVLLKGAYECVERSGVDNVLPMNLAPKPTKEPPWRLISNAMLVNCFLLLWSVRYETLRTVPLVVRQGDWLFSVDLTDAYHQWLLVEESRRLFGHSVELTQLQMLELERKGRLPEGFVWDRQSPLVRIYLRPVGIPMGFTNACAVFTKISRVYVAKWRREGKRCVHLLDDLMFSVSGTFEEACAVRDEVLRDLEYLGAQVNWTKSVLTPGKCLCFLGMLVDSVSYRFFVPEKKVIKLKGLVAELLREEKAGKYPEATFRELASVVGKIMSMQVAVPAVRMLTHEAYRLIRPEGEWDNSVVLTKAVVDELLEVVDWIGEFNKLGNPIRRFKGMTELVVTVDAGTGFGWRLEGKERSEELTPEARAVAGEWSGAEEQELWQCWKELLAVERCLLEEKEHLTGSFVLVRVDARTSVAYINKGKGSSVFLSGVMRRIFRLCLRWSVSLVAEHIAGERMIATGVDSMSRLSEFTVAPGVFRELKQLKGFGVVAGHRGYTLDLFAAKKSAKCSRFCSKGATDGAVGDARTFRLGPEENVWACPPLGMLASTVMMLIEAKVQATVVVPNWANQPWFGLLRAQAQHSRELKWHPQRHVMLDVADKRHVHAHVVDKWDFVAFALGPDGASEGQVPAVWPGRKRKAAEGEAQRVRSNPELWRRKAQQGGRRTGLRSGNLSGSGMVPKKRRHAKVLSVCNGIGVASVCWQRMGSPVDVTAVELDSNCRRLTAARFPEEDQSRWDVRELLKEDLGWFQQFDLLIGGFPCQDVSSANKGGQGLEGERSGLFFVIKELVDRVRSGKGHFLLECTDFVGKHTEDFRRVGEMLGAWPCILYASDVSAGYRRRAYWASFPIEVMRPTEVYPSDIMEPGRSSRWDKLPTVVASGQRSWNTATAVVDSTGLLGPLLTVEMERQMGLDDGFTDLEGLHEHERHRMVGNAFQANVMEHILRSWVKHVESTRDFDSTLGFPGEGPSNYQWSSSSGLARTQGGGSSQRRVVERRAALESTAGAYTQLWASSSAAARGVVLRTPAALMVAAAATPVMINLGGDLNRGSSAGCAKRKAKSAAWRSCLPAQQQRLSREPTQGASVTARLGGASEWGITKRLRLGETRVVQQEVKIPGGNGFKQFVAEVRRDLLVAARSDTTWRAYKAWVECFRAWLLKYGLPVEPSAGLWDAWMEVLMDSVAILGLCYAMGTLDVYTAAVSAFMQDGGMRSPYESREFKMEMEGWRRTKGLGKKKKPPVEPWHMAKILERALPPAELTWQQWRQAKVIANMGWQLFNRPQDFSELQVCDLVSEETQLEVTIRYAKNDPRGLTRSPKLSREGGRYCTVTLWEEYAKAEGLVRHPQCTKVKGVPTRCEYCKPAFPSIWKHGGQQSHPILASGVSRCVKALFLGLAEDGFMSQQEARDFSGKSMRCGGVSAAAAEAVRDGVLQGHGGWLQRQSLRHYDLIRESEKCLVSSALTKAVERSSGRP